MNHYLVLGIGEHADRETIRSAFRGLVRRYHPDAGAGSSSTEFRRAAWNHRAIAGRSSRSSLRGPRRSAIGVPINSCADRLSPTCTQPPPTNRTPITSTRHWKAERRLLNGTG
jgi:hypothetical protein